MRDLCKHPDNVKSAAWHFTFSGPLWQVRHLCCAKIGSSPFSVGYTDRLSPILRFLSTFCGKWALDIGLLRNDNRRPRQPTTRRSITIMSHLAGPIRHVAQRAFVLVTLLMDVVRFLWLCLRPSAALAVENLFLH